MSNSSLVDNEVTQNVLTEDLAGLSLPGEKAGRMRLVVLSLFVFGLVLSAHLVHHFCFDNARVMFAFDGKHYLETTKAITEANLVLLAGDLDKYAAMISQSAYVKNMLWDGPLIPGLPALFFTALGRLPAETDWNIYCLGLSLMASLSSVLVLVLAGRILPQARFLPLLSALAFGLCPAVLTATGVNRSETLATLLLLTLLCILPRVHERDARDKEKGRGSIKLVLGGIVGALLVLTKPVLTVVVAALYFFCSFVECPFRFDKRIFKPLAKGLAMLTILASVTVLTISPWCFYTKEKNGKVSITAERGPTYNAAVGTDIETDGWCTAPETVHCSTQKASDSPGAIFAAFWKNHPLELTKMSLRRFARLWMDPWNDFHETIFGAGVVVQRYIHWLYLTLGLAGAFCYVLFGGRSKLSPSQRLLLDCLVLVLIGHNFYAQFQAMARYGFTAMAPLVLLAAYGLSRLFRAKVFTYLAGFSLALVTVLSIHQIEPVTLADRLVPRPYVVKPGETAERTISLSSGQITGQEQVLLLVDYACGDVAPSLSARVNGQRLTGKFISLNHYNSGFYQLFNTMSEHGSLMRTDVDQFHQWRAMPLAASALKVGANSIELRNEGQEDVTVYGDFAPLDGLPENFLLPSPDYFASDRMLVSLTSLESRISGLRPAGGFKPGQRRPRILLALAPALANLTPGMSSKTVTALEAKDFHWYTRQPDGTIAVSKETLKAIGLVSCTLPVSLPEGATHIRVTVSGQVFSKGGPGRLGLSGSIHSPFDKGQDLNHFADHVQAKKGEWAAFREWDLVPLSYLGNKVDKVTVNFAPCPRLEPQYGAGRNCSDLRLKDLRLEVEGLTSIDQGSLGTGKVRYH